MANQHDDVVVAADGSGNYTTRHVIHIKRGVYKEFVVLGQEKRNVVLVGDGMDATVISGSRCCAGERGVGETRENAACSSLLQFQFGPDSFSFCFALCCMFKFTWAVVLKKVYMGRDPPFRVQGKGFIARDLCIENTAGPRKEKGQAVALLSRSDQSVLYRCALRGYQDTLWCARSSKQLSRECTITGTVDFIFGEAAAFCTVAADEDLAAHAAKGTVQTYLGRPWKPFSRVVFMQSTISDVPPDTLYYAEYKNGGPGAAVSGRVNWRGVHANLDASTARSFTVEKLINGNDWLPSTGVEYKPGL
uniref:Pectinesterase n=1 Tax=Setaria italica TaxID=4555 RepID=K3ZZV8_SETIT